MPVARQIAHCQFLSIYRRGFFCPRPPKNRPISLQLVLMIMEREATFLWRHIWRHHVNNFTTNLFHCFFPPLTRWQDARRRGILRLSLTKGDDFINFFAPYALAQIIEIVIYICALRLRPTFAPVKSFLKVGGRAHTSLWNWPQFICLYAGKDQDSNTKLRYWLSG